jgi:branched-chain amino acid transport system ATP-binding protein
LPYALLLAAADRFLLYALFDGDLLSPSGFVVAFLVLAALCLLAWRVTRARRMVAQYPWLYERAGLFGWRERG